MSASLDKLISLLTNMQNQVIDWLALHTHTNTVFRAGYADRGSAQHLKYCPSTFLENLGGNRRWTDRLRPQRSRQNSRAQLSWNRRGKRAMVLHCCRYTWTTASWCWWVPAVRAYAQDSSQGQGLYLLAKAKPLKKRLLCEIKQPKSMHSLMFETKSQQDAVSGHYGLALALKVRLREIRRALHRVLFLLPPGLSPVELPCSRSW